MITMIFDLLSYLTLGLLVIPGLIQFLMDTMMQFITIPNLGGILPG